MRLELRRLGLLATLAAASLSLQPAHAALFEDEEARRAILDLRQKVEALNNALKAQTDDNAQLRRVLVDLQGQIDQMQVEVNKTRGAQEQLVRDVSDLQVRQRDAQSGIDERLRKFEPMTVKVDGLEFQVEQGEKRDYDAAMDTFRKGDFVAAQAALQRFVQRNPQSGYMPSALFWLGNAEYATKDYKESMGHFRQMLAAAPGHARAAEAMLAISNVQLELKDTKAARKTLEDLIKTYPDAETAQAAKDRLARLR